ncbi:hypothetical protein C8R44DRAFT_731279 [Mycena epipterygia]|nr:hypothetical protein C8R44DRAFT_731279 [Mycena epipterygia]
MLSSVRDWAGAAIAEISCWMKGAERGYALFRETSKLVVHAGPQCWSADKVRNIWVNAEIELQWKTECPAIGAVETEDGNGAHSITRAERRANNKGGVIVTGASHNVVRDVFVGGVETHVFVGPIQLMNGNVTRTWMTLDIEQEAKNGELLDGGAACECGSLFGKALSEWRSVTDDHQTGKGWTQSEPYMVVIRDVEKMLEVKRDGGWCGTKGLRGCRDSLPFPQDDVYGGSQWILWQGVGSGMFWESEAATYSPTRHRVSSGSQNGMSSGKMGRKQSCAGNFETKARVLGYTRGCMLFAELDMELRETGYAGSMPNWCRHNSFVLRMPDEAMGLLWCLTTQVMELRREIGLKGYKKFATVKEPKWPICVGIYQAAVKPN